MVSALGKRPQHEHDRCRSRKNSKLIVRGIDYPFLTSRAAIHIHLIGNHKSHPLDRLGSSEWKASFSKEKKQALNDPRMPGLKTVDLFTGCLLARAYTNGRIRNASSLVSNNAHPKPSIALLRNLTIETQSTIQAQPKATDSGSLGLLSFQLPDHIVHLISAYVF
jgi:hypothetical protein